MSYTFDKIIKAYNNKNPNIKIITNYSSSGKIASMIKYGANIDIFLSANERYINLLCKEIKCLKQDIYALGQLVLIYPKSILSKNINDILSNSKKIIIANPKIAPYGKASKKVLDTFNIHNNIIKVSSISKTMTIIIKSRNTGFSAKSISKVVQQRHLLNEFNILDINQSLYNPISQKMLLLNKKASDFYTFILSKISQNILQNNGFKKY
jgi:molybdate transport system substrate-binding protein